MRNVGADGRRRDEIRGTLRDCRTESREWITVYDLVRDKLERTKRRKFRLENLWSRSDLLSDTM